MNLKILFTAFVILALSVQLVAQETVFDRNINLSKDIHEVPVVSRYEERLDIKGRFELVNNVNLWVEEVGEGTPMLLISGGPGTSHHYFHPHFIKAANFSKLIYYDMRGVGLSDRNPGKNGYSIIQAVEDLESLRKKLGYDKWVVLGLSFGGAVAQLYAIKHPEHLAGMILLSSVLPMSIDIGLGSRQYNYISSEERKRISEIYSIAGERAIPVHSDRVNPALQKKMLYNAFTNGDWKRRHLKKWGKEDIAMYAHYEFVHDKNYYFAMMNDYFEYDLKGLFKSFPIPTLIIEGRWDLAYSSDKAKKFFDQFPTALHVYFDDAGHLPFEDKPEELMLELKKFIASLNPIKENKLENWKSAISKINYRKKNLIQRPIFSAKSN